MDRISLSKEFLAILTPLGPKCKIIEQLLADLDMNKFKEYLGMLKKLIAENEEELAKKNFTTKDIDAMVEGLIQELVSGPSIDIKCIVHNFIKAGAKKDAQFQKRVRLVLWQDYQQL
jgi:hypothetical protein